MNLESFLDNMNFIFHQLIQESIKQILPLHHINIPNNVKIDNFEKKIPNILCKINSGCCAEIKKDESHFLLLITILLGKGELFNSLNVLYPMNFDIKNIDPFLD